MAPAGQGWPGAVRLLALDEIDSTNSEALRQAAAGQRGPLWVTARRQTAGRGRSGRAWASPTGNLHASLLLDLGCGPREAAGLSLVAGVAVLEAVEALATRRGRSPALRLKWPNDLLVGPAKLAGILVESAVRIEGRLDAVIGVGLNVANAPADLGRQATCLAVLEIGTDTDEAVAALARSFHHWLDKWQEGAGFAAIRQAWLERSVPSGTGLSVNTGRGAVTGRFDSIDIDGALLLRSESGSIVRIAFGDVTIAPG